MRRFKQLRTVLLYLLIPGLGAVTPLLVYPALTSTYGPQGFASVAIAQAIGLAGATICELGWSVLGPQRIASADQVRRSDLYESALATKGLACIVGAPIAAFATSLIVTEHHAASALLAAASLLTCLSPSWFLVGANRPVAILVFESLPRLLLMALVAGLLLMGAPLSVYAVATFVAVVITQIAVSVRFKLRLLPSRNAFATGGSVIRAQLPLTSGRIVSVVYTTLPVAIVGVVNPAAVPVFAAIDRLMRMSLAILGGIPSRLQSWVGAVTGPDRRRRSRQSLLMNTALGFVAACGFAVLAPPVADIVFSGTIHLPIEVSALGASILLAICASRGFGLSLVAEGKANWIALANVGAAVVGVVATFLLARALGAPGAQLAGLSAELVGIAIQASCLVFLPFRQVED